jgi:hypothetical protein
MGQGQDLALRNRVGSMESNFPTPEEDSLLDPKDHTYEHGEDADYRGRNNLSTVKVQIIPKVRMWNLVQFKNRFNKDDGRYAADVLMAGPKIEKENQDELKLHEQPCSSRSNLARQNKQPFLLIMLHLLQRIMSRRCLMNSS